MRPVKVNWRYFTLLREPGSSLKRDSTIVFGFVNECFNSSKTINIKAIRENGWSFYFLCPSFSLYNIPFKSMCPVSLPFYKPAQCYRVHGRDASLYSAQMPLWEDTECCLPDTPGNPPAHPGRWLQAHAGAAAGHLPPHKSSWTAASFHEGS